MGWLVERLFLGATLKEIARREEVTRAAVSLRVSELMELVDVDPVPRGRAGRRKQPLKTSFKFSD